MADALSTHPIHLGRGGTAVREPEHTGDMEWYEGYPAEGCDVSGAVAEPRVRVRCSFFAGLWRCALRSEPCRTAVKNARAWYRDVSGALGVIHPSAGS
jgi:hypothetical protein